MDGSVKVAVGEQTGWQWKENVSDEVPDAKHLALVSLSFPHRSLETSAPGIPTTSASELASNDPLVKVYSVPFEELAGFINTVKTIPSSADTINGGDRRQWVMQTGRTKNNNSGIIARAEQALRELWDMIQVIPVH